MSRVPNLDGFLARVTDTYGQTGHELGSLEAWRDLAMSAMYAYRELHREYMRLSWENGKDGGRPKKALDPDVLRVVKARLPVGEMTEADLLKRLRRNATLKPLTNYMLRKYLAEAKKRKS